MENEVKKIINIIKTNGVGFMECYCSVRNGKFGPSIKEECPLFFSDGKEPLGQLDLNGLDLGGGSSCKVPKEKTEGIPLGINFIWLGARFGKCTVYIIDEWAEEKSI